MDPDRYWCITSFEIGVMASSRNRALVSETREFREGMKGVPLLTKAVRRIQCPGEKADGDQVVEYLLDEREAPAEEFTLSAFGIKEPRGMPPVGGGSRWYLWFIVVAILSLGVGGFFWRRVQRRNLATAQAPTTTQGRNRP